MSGRGGGGPIGDRDLDRLLALVLPPPAAPADLADRIAARAAATPQSPPLPPRRAPRSGRRRVGRRAWAGAILGSFLLSIAAAAAVLGGHVDFHRLASLPALLLGHHAAEPAAARAPSRVSLTSAPTVAAPPDAPSVDQRSPIRAGAAVPPPLDEQRSGARVAGRAAPARVAGLGHRAVPPRVAERREPRRIAGPRSMPRATPPARLEASHAAREDDTATANRQSLQASERAAARHPASVDARDAGAGERARDGMRGDRGQRWRGQAGDGGRGWRRGRFAPWRTGGQEPDGAAASPEAGWTDRPADRAKPEKGANPRGNGRRGVRAGRLRGRRR